MVYCRYHLISPFCLGKFRPLKDEEITIEHLIPKSRIRQAGFRNRFGYVGINTSSKENTDISCTKCNHFKKNMTDLEFAYKLQYFAKYQLPLKSRSKLYHSLVYAPPLLTLTTHQKEKISHILFFGECIINGNNAYLRLGKSRVTIESGIITEYRKEKKPILQK